MSIQSRLETVKAARQRYDHLAGVARAQAICAFVVWEHRAEGWGRFKKRDGTLSADVIALKVGGETQVHTFDILGDSENAARPQFGPTEPTGRGDLARWVEPVRPFDVPEPPVPVPVPVPWCPSRQHHKTSPPCKRRWPHSARASMPSPPVPGSISTRC